MAISQNNDAKWKKSKYNDYILYYSIYIEFWKMQMNP